MSATKFLQAEQTLGRALRSAKAFARDEQSRAEIANLERLVIEARFCAVGLALGDVSAQAYVDRWVAFCKETT